MTPSRWLALPAAAVALVLTLAALAVPAAATTPAPVPVWTNGQAVGYGTSLDLGALANTYILGPIRNNTAAFNITSIQALNATGSFDLWEVDQVTNTTGGYYALASQAAEGIKFDLNVNVTVDALPQAGTYTGTLDPFLGCIFPVIPKTTGTVAATLSSKGLTVANGFTRYQASNLATVNATQNADVQAKVVFTGYHLPMIATNATACTETVTYGNPNFTLKVDTQNQIRSFYTPSWDSFNFPIADNETWWANSTATLGATLAGTIDVVGLSPHDQAAFFDNLTKAFQSLGLVVTGLNGFPINLANITVTAGLVNIVQNGVVRDYPVNVAPAFRASASVMTLSDGNQYPVYLITNASYACPYTGAIGTVPVGYAAEYAPDFPAQGAGMVVGYELLVCTGSMSLPGFTLTNTKPSDARHRISQTESTYAAAPVAAGNPIADFFLRAPYWGLLIVAVAVIAVVGLLVVRRRRRPPVAAAPPSMPPQTPPSGPGTP